MKKQITLLVVMASLVSQVAFGACKNGVCSRRTTKQTIGQAIQRKYAPATRVVAIRVATRVPVGRSCRPGACARPSRTATSRVATVRVARVAFVARKTNGCKSGACSRTTKRTPAKSATRSRCSGGVCRRK